MPFFGVFSNHNVVWSALLYQNMGSSAEPIGFRNGSQVLYEELGDLRGEAIALQTVSNCRFILKDLDGAVATGYKALRLFSECGDQHGRNMVVKLLQSLGQTQQQLQEATTKKPTQPTAGETEKAETAETATKTEEQRQREEHLKNIMEEQVVFEYAWVPSETQDPKNFGEKRNASSGSRKIFAVSELRDQKLLKQLARCRGKAGGPKNPMTTPYFVNLMNGRLLSSSLLQGAMEASACASVVYDVTKLNNMTPLEVIDVAIRLTQALQVIEEVFGLDVILASTQNIASATGRGRVREGFSVS